MAINFPDSPNNGDSFTSNNKTWVFDGTVWNITSGTNSVADGAITAAKIASNAVTSDKITAGAVNQSKLGTTFSGITITTTANRNTDIPSPFTGQFCFLTDTSLLQRYTGSAWVVAVATAPAAPTALSATALSTTSVSIAFTPGADNGSAITNYQYALSTNSGSTYSSFLALDPADSMSPITISGLTQSTAYTIKLRAVNTMGAGTESAGVSVTTLAPLTIEYLVIAGGGGGGRNIVPGTYGGSGGGGAGGYRSSVSGESSGGGASAESQLVLTKDTLYAVEVGGGGNGATTQATNGSNGTNSVFSTITSTSGGGGGGRENTGSGQNGGSGGGAPQLSANRGTGTANQGFAGGVSPGGRNDNVGSGGGGAGGVGGDTSTNVGGAGGAGVSSSITGSAVARGGGGSGGGNLSNGGATAGGAAAPTSSGANGNNGTSNTGGGGSGHPIGTPVGNGGNGGSGVVILRYSSGYTITLGAGLTGSTSTVGANKVTTITAGSGNVSWT